MKFLFPIKGSYHKTQNFGEKEMDYSKLIPSGAHNGYDYGAKRGTPVVAPDDGIIKSVYGDALPGKGGYGNYVRMYTWRDGKTFDHVLGHLLSVTVEAGKYAKRGELLGFIDSTGYSTGDHLHWGVRLRDGNDNVINYDNGYYGYFDFKDFIEAKDIDEHFQVDDYYGQKRSLIREKLWKIKNEKYAKKKALQSSVPYTSRIMKAFVYGFWGQEVVYNPALYSLWADMTKPAWLKLNI